MPLSALRRALATCTTAIALAAVGAPADASAVAPPAGFQAFAPDSIWNLPLRADAPVSPDSARYMGWVKGALAAKGGWINSTQCGMPLYWANAATPKVKVALDHPSYMDPALMRAWSAVPIPAGAAPANCGDRNFSVAQEQPDGTVKEWEFWNATQRSNGSWVAQWGGAMDDMRTNRGVASPLTWQDPSARSWIEGHATPGWNVTASSVSQNAGVITQADLKAGRIDHAVAIAFNDAAAGKWLWPAQRSDGGSSDPNALPEGAHLRLDPKLDLAGLKLTPLVRMIAQAAQRYGIVARDRTNDANVFYTEPPAPGQRDPVSGLLDGQWPNQALAAFPWASLRVLDAPTCTDYRGCTAVSKARIDLDQAPAPGDVVTLDTSNSVLEQARTKVAWDLNGDGSYETGTGTAVKAKVVAGPAGQQTVGVRITTLDGQVLTATKTFTVGARTSPASSAVPVATVTFSPSPSAASRAGARPRAAVPSAAGTSAVTVSRLAVARKQSTLRLSLRCPSSARTCTGRVTVRLARPLRTSSGTLAKHAHLGSARFAIAPGQSRTLVLPTAKRAIRYLRAARVKRMAVQGPGRRPARGARSGG